MNKEDYGTAISMMIAQSRPATSSYPTFFKNLRWCYRAGVEYLDEKQKVLATSNKPSYSNNRTGSCCRGTNAFPRRIIRIVFVSDEN
jgi:hypothetical protein